MITKTHILLLLILSISIGFSDIPVNYSKTVAKSFNINIQPGEDSQKKDTKYRYPGKAMLYSAILPGLGELYTGAWKRAILFSGVEVTAWSLWYTNNKKGDDETERYKAYADEHWDFNRWMENYYDWQNDTLLNVLFQNQESGSYENIWEGSHHLNFTKTYNGDVIVMSTVDPENPIEGEPVFSDYFEYNIAGDSMSINWELYNNLNAAVDPNFSVQKDRNYYENIFKYNHFHAGWDDIAETEIYDSDGYLIAKTKKKWRYREMRDNVANYQEIAVYALSAVMFNHIASMIDAVFTANAKNSQLTVSARPTFNPAGKLGVGGIKVSIRW